MKIGHRQTDSQTDTNSKRNTVGVKGVKWGAVGVASGEGLGGCCGREGRDGEGGEERRGGDITGGISRGVIISFPDGSNLVDLIYIERLRDKWMDRWINK